MKQEQIVSKIKTNWHLVMYGIPLANISAFKVIKGGAMGDTAWFRRDNKEIVFTEELAKTISDTKTTDLQQEFMCKVALAHESAHSARTRFWPKIKVNSAAIWMVNHLEDWRINRPLSNPKGSFPFFRDAATMLNDALANTDKRKEVEEKMKKDELGDSTSAVKEFSKFWGALWVPALSPVTFEATYDNLVEQMQDDEAVEVAMACKSHVMKSYNAQARDSGSHTDLIDASLRMVKAAEKIIEITDKIYKHKKVDEFLETLSNKAEDIKKAIEKELKERKDRKDKKEEIKEKMKKDKEKEEKGKKPDDKGDKDKGKDGKKPDDGDGDEKGDKGKGKDGKEPGDGDGDEKGDGKGKGKDGKDPGDGDEKGDGKGKGKDGKDPGDGDGDEKGDGKGKGGKNPGKDGKGSGEPGDGEGDGGPSDSELEGMLPKRTPKNVTERSISEIPTEVLEDLLEKINKGEVGKPDGDGRMLTPEEREKMEKQLEHGEGVGNFMEEGRPTDQIIKPVSRQEVMKYLSKIQPLLQKAERAMANSTSFGKGVHLPTINAQHGGGDVEIGNVAVKMENPSGSSDLPLFMDIEAGHLAKSKKRIQLGKLIIAVDGSGSMGSYWPQVQKALVVFCYVMHKQKIPCVIVGNNDDATAVLSEGICAPGQMEKDIGRILNMRANGDRDMASTSLTRMVSFVEKMSNIGAPEHNRMIILSDCQANDIDVSTAEKALYNIRMPSLMLVPASGGHWSSYTKGIHDRFKGIRTGKMTHASIMYASSSNVDDPLLTQGILQTCLWIADPSGYAKKYPQPVNSATMTIPDMESLEAPKPNRANRGMGGLGGG